MRARAGLVVGWLLITSCEYQRPADVSECGDGILDPSEICDDGNTVTESCAYGETSCMVCSEMCQLIPGAASFCGDGLLDTTAGEACDDHNNSACGSCDDTCHNVNVLEQATGSITAVRRGDLEDRETFTLSDGIHSPITFEFNDFGGVGIDHVEVSLLGISPVSTIGVRSAMISAIASVADKFDIIASEGSGVVILTNRHFSSIGNQAIQETVFKFGFMVTGMSGGVGTSCLSGEGCQDNKDCLSMVCLPSQVCQ